ncbi:MAG: DivIVA domain-containing protein [Candidatus Atribacteria bacterium]|nr:DivIVA domain-containing protein [Candidatus Atribacteria bacterium]
MDLKPENILEVEFSRSFRGYNEDEVDEFIEEIASAVEAMQKEQEKLQQENEEYKRKVNELNQYVKRLEGNLEEWKKQLEIEKELTRRESQMHLKEAQIRGNRIVDEALKKKKEIENNYAELKEKYRVFQIRFKSLLQTFMDSIDWKEQPPEINTPASDKMNLTEIHPPEDITLFSFQDLEEDQK